MLFVVLAYLKYTFKGNAEVYKELNNSVVNIAKAKQYQGHQDKNELKELPDESVQAWWVD